MTMDDLWGVAVVVVIAALIVGQLKDKLSKTENDCNRINLNYAKLVKKAKKPEIPYEKLLEENNKLKNENRLLNKKINNENMEKNIEKKQKTQNMVIKEFNDKDETLIEKTNKEKMQLTENVQMLANELDELNENNRQLNDKIIKDEKLNNIYNMVNLRNELKEENKLYKKIMVFNNRKNFIESKGTLQYNDSTLDFKGKKDNKEITINNNNTIHREYSIGPISGYGEYKLEKEENIHSNGSIFFCGL